MNDAMQDHLIVVDAASSVTHRQRRLIEDALEI